MEYTERLRRELPRVFAAHGVRRVLDAPCGDYSWFGLVERAGVAYTGADIVQALVDQNQAKYGSDDTRFVRLDLTRDPLPDADLWLCRDCLFHLSNEHVFQALANFRRSRIPLFLASSHVKCKENVDIVTGGFRQLNLLLPPFGLREPLLWIDDWIEGFPERKLGLWSRQMLGAGG